MFLMLTQLQEIYVISNRDVKSMRLLDEWLHYIDTQETIPLFEQPQTSYATPRLNTVDWETQSEIVTQIVRDRNLSRLRQIDSLGEILNALHLLRECEEKVFLREVFQHLLDLEASQSCAVDREQLAQTLLNFLPFGVYLLALFLDSQTWGTHKYRLREGLQLITPALLRELVLDANTMLVLVRSPFQRLLQELHELPLQHFADIVELIALAVRRAEIAMDLLLECMSPEMYRLLVGRPKAIDHLVGCCNGLALDHIDEAAEAKPGQDSLNLYADGVNDGFSVVRSFLRIDSDVGSMLRLGDHVRLTATEPPRNAPLDRPYSMDAVVIKAEVGSASFRCIHHPPVFLQNASWTVAHCGSFVTTKTALDAVIKFHVGQSRCCGLYNALVGLSRDTAMQGAQDELRSTPDERLNTSQGEALKAAMSTPLTFLWGPPGTGKTYTIVAILVQLLKSMPKTRLLVTAPTHNAVDNILQKFVDEDGDSKTGVEPVRVSTSVRFSRYPILDLNFRPK
jgi:hypothetical protein